MNSSDITGRPARQVILQLAGSNEQERSQAARRIRLYLYKQPRDQRGEFLAPQLERYELLKQIVLNTFREKDFPVVQTLRVLAQTCVQARQAAISMFGDNSTPNQNQLWVGVSCELVLNYAAPAASAAFDIYLGLLHAKVESGEIGFTGLQSLAAQAFGAMGREGLPAFDALFRAQCESSDDEIEKTLCAQIALDPALHEKVRDHLNSSDRDVRYATLGLLEKYGVGYQRLREAALHALSDTDFYCRRTAATILRRYFAHDAESLQALNRARGNPGRPEFQLPEPTMALEPSVLAAAERDEDDPLFKEALHSLQHRFITARESEQRSLMALFARPDFQTVSIAKKLLAKIHRIIRYNDRSAIEPHMIASTLCTVVEFVGPGGSGAVDDIIALTEFGDFYLPLECAARALKNMGASGVKGIPTLLEAARKYPDRAYYCQMSLSTLCQYEPELVQKLCKWIELGSPAERSVAVAVLRQYPPGARAALPFALEFAKTGGAVNAEHVADIFSVVAGESDAAREQLMNLTQHEDGGVRGHAFLAMSVFPNVPEAIKILEAGLKDEYAFTRCCALTALCESNIPASEKIRYCLAMLDDNEGFDDFVPCDEASRQLAKLGAAAAPAIPQLLNANVSMNEWLEILEAAGLAASPALPWLKETLKSNLINDPFLEDSHNQRIEKLIWRLAPSSLQ